ncbi:MarR family transcriptional regulator [Nocardia neocaledoniensis]|uniref:MarR family winged helix-turn-helix transcriptional regulator n=1 Tax=Nocardia neocaledoniensis TaxID=236511 RepID=UPI0033DF3589
MPKATRPDLAAMLVPLGRALTDAELPVLERHGLTMWAYAVLLGLDEEPVHTQAALAKAIRADKTRIIPVLDDLQRRGLLRRDPDPTDRRVNLVRLTPAGARLRDRAQRDIQDQEQRLLADLPAEDRRTFLRVLQYLAEREK